MGTSSEQLRASRAFLSYSRDDTQFATWLRTALKDRGILAFQDIEDTFLSEKWWLRLKALIALADSFIFVLSPRSAASKVCRQEISHAESLNKRIFPVVIESVDWASVPEGLSSRHSVFFTDVARQQDALNTLVAALLTDIDWVREHTRLYERASLWEAQNRRSFELLRGRALKVAERWVSQQPRMAEAPTSLHRAYIQASRAAANRRQLFWSLSVSTAVGAAIVYAWQTYDRGTLSADSEPINSTIEVDGAALGARIRNLSLRSGPHNLQAWAPNHFKVQRTVSLPRRGTAETQFSLEDGRSWQKPYISPSIQGGLALLPSQDGLVLATNELDHIVLLSAATGEVLRRIETPEGNKRTFLGLNLGGDLGTVVLSALDAQRSGPEVLMIWAGAQPEELWRWKGPATSFDHSAGLAVAVLSPERSGGAIIAVAGRDGHVYFLDGKTGQQIGVVEISQGPIPAAPVLVPSANGRNVELTAFFHSGTVGGSPVDLAITNPLHAVSINVDAKQIAWQRDFGVGWNAAGSPLVLDGITYAIIWNDTRWQAVELVFGGHGNDKRGPGGELPASPAGAPILADLEGNGVRDLVFQFKDTSVPMLALRTSDGATIWRGPDHLSAEQSRGAGNSFLITTNGALLVQREDGLAAVDPRSGRVEWQVAGRPIGTVVGDWDGDGRDEVIVAMRGVGLLCLDDAGRTLWTLRMEASEAKPWALVRSSAGGATNDILIIRPASSIDLVHGPHILWQRNAAALLQATPVVAKAEDGTRVVIEVGDWGNDINLRAFNGADGSTRWSAKEAFYANRGAALADLDGDGFQNIIALGHQPDGAELLVYRPSDGHIVRSVPVEVQGWFSCTPVVADYRGSGKSDVAFSTWDDRSIVMVEGRTGTILWRQRTGKGNMQGLSAGDLDGDGLPDVVAVSFDGNVYALRGKDGELLWESPLDGGGWTDPVIAHLPGNVIPAVLVISQTGRLYVFDGRSGQQRWTSDIAGGYKVAGHPIVVEQDGRTIILAPLGEAGLVAFDPVRGVEVWRSPAGSPVIATPAEITLSGGKTRAVIVAAATGDVWLLRISDGAPIWRARVVEGFTGERPMIEADPVVVDLNGDGMPDILIAGYDMKLHAVNGTGSIGARR